MSVARRIRTKHPLPNVLTLAGEKACTMCRQTRPLREFVRAAKLPGGIAGHCRLCQKRVNADWYQRNRARIAARLADYEAANPHKQAAQQALQDAVRLGLLVRGPCAVCGATPTHGHHHSYAEADRLAVTWLCVLHHREVHRDPTHPLNPDRISEAP